MFNEVTLDEFRKNGLEPEESYSDTEMSFSLEEGSIIYKSFNRTFLVSDYTFWVPATFNQFKNIGEKVKSSLIHENEPFAIQFISAEPEFNCYEFDFVNVSDEKKNEMFRMFNEARSLYHFESSYIKQPKNVNIKPRYRSDLSLRNDHLSICFNPKTVSLSLSKVTQSGSIIITDLKKSGDVLNELFSEITENISRELGTEGIKHSVEIHPYGFRLDIRSKKENLNLVFELISSDNSQIRLFVNEILEKGTSSPLFEEWDGQTFINFESGNLSFVDNGLLNSIKSRQLASHFSFL